MLKLLKTISIVAMLTISPTFAMADPVATPAVDTSSLTEKQKQELQKIAEKFRQENAPTAPNGLNIPIPSAETLDSYAEFGKKYASVITEAAKGLGQTANEFMQTPAGKWALFLIAWNYFGQDLLGLILSMIWFSTMIPLLAIATKFFILNPKREILEMVKAEPSMSRERLAVLVKMTEEYQVMIAVFCVAFAIMTVVGLALL